MPGLTTAYRGDHKPEGTESGNVDAGIGVLARHQSWSQADRKRAVMQRLLDGAEQPAPMWTGGAGYTSSSAR